MQTLTYGTVGATEVQWNGLDDWPSVMHGDRLFRKVRLGRSGERHPFHMKQHLEYVELFYGMTNRALWSRIQERQLRVMCSWVFFTDYPINVKK